MKKIGLYIHIPFCRQKCRYCSFVSFCDLSKMESYIKCLCQEISSSKVADDTIVDTIYIGGGTPSLLDKNLLKQIFDTIHSKFTLSDDCEISIECNPNSVTYDLACFWHKLGINRVSIGLQSASNKILRNLGRIHRLKDFKQALQYIKSAGITNINADMMLGVTHQNMWDIKKTVNLLVKCGVTHISAYSLILEENTPLYQSVISGKEKLPDDKVTVHMYDVVYNMLQKYGYYRYEISNFAKLDMECRHNLHCWQCHEYLGFGVSAHGYIGDTRYSNTEKIDEYIQNILSGKSVVTHSVTLTQSDKIEECIMLGLRTKYGISLSHLKDAFGYDLCKEKKSEIDKYQKLGLIQIDDDILRLEPSGFYVSNTIISDLI